jgi:hypothetical protein
VFICAAAWLLVLTTRTSAHEPSADAATGPTTASLQKLTDTLRVRLGIDRPVTASIVPVNPKVASMVPPAAPGQPFQLVIEQSFLQGLSSDELSAVVAHELGHIWVSTHHPFLQTEELANSIAMRAVTRDSLERVYAKVWARDGSAGDLVEFLGPPRADVEGLDPRR